MQNLFDGIQRAAFNVVSNTMGYNASWVPSDSTDEQKARVLLKDASETAKVLQIEYDPRRAIMEYFEGEFIGLKKRVDGRHDEFVTIASIKYLVDDIEVKHDGKTYLAHLRLA